MDFWTSCGVFGSFWELFRRDFGVISEGFRDEKQRTAGALPCFVLLCLALPCIALLWRAFSLL